MEDVRLTTEPIALDPILEAVRRPDCGAVALFLGTVRNRAAGVRVDHLEYEAYPCMAEKAMRALADAARARWQLGHLSVVHRTGRLEVGEVSVVIAISSVHRAEALEACRWAIDTLKETVPIWKREFGEGGASWIEGPDRVASPPLGGGLQETTGAT